MPIVKIFIAEDCPNCGEAREVASHIEQNYPWLAVVIIDIAQERALVPDSVFATPTFMINNKIVSLGNPNLDDVAQWAENAIAEVAPWLVCASGKPEAWK